MVGANAEDEVSLVQEMDEDLVQRFHSHESICWHHWAESDAFWEACNVFVIQKIQTELPSNGSCHAADSMNFGSGTVQK